MRALALAALFCVACSDLNLAPGKQCGPSGACPAGQICDGTNHCVLAGADLSVLPDVGVTDDMHVTTANGGACGANADCTNHYCVDGYCCDGACTGQCEACDITPGVCSQTTGLPHGERTACLSTGLACGGSCGSSRTGCDYAATSQQCNTSCPSTTQQTTYFCDGAGSCNTTGTTATCPNSFVCANGSCDPTCNGNGDCAANLACLSHACGTPHNCAEWQASGVVTDGQYVIDPDGVGPDPSFSVWCANMAPADMGVPVEYLTLVNTNTPADVAAAIGAGLDPAGSVSNFSLYPGGSGCACSGNAVVTFQRVRLDISNPSAIQVITNDRTFASVSPEMTGCFSSTSGCTASGSLGWSEVGDCRGPSSNGGEAQIDLRGTPFYVGSGAFWDSWWGGVYAPGATQTIAPSRQVATFSGGGYCALICASGCARRTVPVAFNTNVAAFTPALVNGDFTASPKLTGWTLTGSASSFTVGADANLSSRTTVVTGATVGSMSQTFVVPRDATRLYFAYAGTGGSVSLAQVTSGGDVAIGSVSPPVGSGLPATTYSPRWWAIDGYAGQTLRLTVATTAASSGLMVSGFDVLRGSIDGFIKDPSFLRESLAASWTLTGTVNGKLDNAWDVVLPWWDIITYDNAGGTHEAETGAVYQCVTIPAAGTLPGMRFSMLGGNQFVKLYDVGVGGSCAYPPSSAAVLTAIGPSNNNAWSANSWDLTPYGGHNAIIAIEDNSTAAWGWVDCSEIYVTSNTNGP